MNEFDLKRHLAAKKAEQKVEEAFKVIFDNLNAMGGGADFEKQALELITKNHRTLQQSFWKSLFNVAFSYGKLEDRFFDLRNQGSKVACQVATQAIEDEKVHIPFI